MRVHLEVTFDTPAVARPRRPRTLIALAALALALLLPAVALASHLFSDVPTSHTFHTNISNLAGAGVTAGCGGTKYCPDEPVTRGQMAAFLNRGLGRVAETEVHTTVTGIPETEVASVTLTPGTATASGTQFVHAQFNGRVRFSNITSCPCDLSIRLRNGAEGINDWAVVVTVFSAGVFYPIHAGGVTMVDGTGPVPITLHTQIFNSGGTTVAYEVAGNVTAESIPFGSTGTSAP